YIEIAQEIATILGKDYAKSLGRRFVDGMEDPINYTITEAIQQFRKVTRTERASRRAYGEEEHAMNVEKKSEDSLATQMVQAMTDLARTQAEAQRVMLEEMKGMLAQKNNSSRPVQTNAVTTGRSETNLYTTPVIGGGTTGYRGPTCYACGERGHYSTECQNPKSMEEQRAIQTKVQENMARSQQRRAEVGAGGQPGQMVQTQPKTELVAAVEMYPFEGEDDGMIYTSNMVDALFDEGGMDA
ncbi:hypothetical protein DFH27DRAFT_565631, partial [Peziza echinospora]